jgi:hypothetical protein
MAHPADDRLDVVPVEFNGVTLNVKTKVQVFKFMKTLEKSPFSAIEMVLAAPEDVEALEELEFGFDELEDLLNKITSALGVGNRGN